MAREVVGSDKQHPPAFYLDIAKYELTLCVMYCYWNMQFTIGSTAGANHGYSNMYAIGF